MNNILKKYKEIWLYLIFGVVTTVVSIATFAFFEWVGLNVLFANVLSWIIAVLVAFITNTLWVFESSLKEKLFSKLIKFYGARLSTLAVEEIILWVFITRLGVGSLIVKTVAQVVVIVLNFVVSKLFVFKKSDAK